MTLQHRVTSILSTLLLAALYSAPQLGAQQSNSSPAQQPTETTQQPQSPANKLADASCCEARAESGRDE